VKQIPCGNDNKKSKGRCGFPAGLTTRKAKADAAATTDADPYGMTERKTRAIADRKAMAEGAPIE
jgi:hypothetical protein